MANTTFGCTIVYMILVCLSGGSFDRADQVVNGRQGGGQPSSREFHVLRRIGRSVCGADCWGPGCGVPTICGHAPLGIRAGLGVVRPRCAGYI